MGDGDLYWVVEGGFVLQTIGQVVVLRCGLTLLERGRSGTSTVA